MPQLAPTSLAGALLVFAVASLAILVAGTRLSALADRLADRTGLGEAVFGGIFLGAITSISGVVTSVTAASRGLPELALSNAVGGIAAQTAFLGIADLAHRGVNLEHAAASTPNLVQTALLLVLLGLAAVALAWPEPAFAAVHPLSLGLVLAYLGGVVWTRRAHETPMWRPRRTPETRPDEPDEPRSRRGSGALWLQLVLLGVVVAAAGHADALAGETLTRRTGLSQTAVGGLLTSVSTSLPELVTTLAAVRRGALTLAVGGIVGGNCFDVLFLSASDVAFREGSIYAHASASVGLLVSVSVVMNAVLILGLLRREKHGPGNVGIETVVVLGLWGALAVLLATTP
ncbi:MAG: sodium:calcium antiporter [Myxococcota bacterium]|nr:sodium:calcium antiporter [Myxococcota bacterium]